MNPFVGVVGVVALVVSWGMAQPWLARRRAEAAREDLSTKSTETLRAQINCVLRSARWERFSAAKKILMNDEWTARRVLEEMIALEQEALEADRVAGPGERDNTHQFYDGGLAGLREALEHRLHSS